MTESESHQLLPGELPSSSEAEDAAHWVAVYTELTDSLLRHPQTDAFQETLDRYRHRLGFWRTRLHDLSDNGGLVQTDAPAEAS